MRKNVFKIFSYAECDDFAAFLNDMAINGWHFVGWDSSKWKNRLVFEKGEPMRREYAVEIYVTKNKEEKKAVQEKQEFIDYCEMAGWKWIAVKGNFYIFEKISQDCTPIMTEEEKLKIIAKTTFSERLMWLLIPFEIFFWFILGFLFGDINIWLFQDKIFAASMVPFFACLFTLWGLLSVTLWEKQKRKNLESGNDIHFRKENNKILLSEKSYFILSRVWQLLLLAILGWIGQEKIIGMFLILFVLGLFLEINVIMNRGEKGEHGWQSVLCSVLITILVFGRAINPEAPEMKETTVLQEQDFEKVVCGELEAITGSVTSYTVTYENEDHFWCVYKSDYEWILKRVWNEFEPYIKDDIRDDTEKWEAETAISGVFSIFSDEESILTKDIIVSKNSSNRLYLIRYENKVVYMREKTDLTQEQIDTICEKLDLK